MAKLKISRTEANELIDQQIKIAKDNLQELEKKGIIFSSGRTKSLEDDKKIINIIGRWGGRITRTQLKKLSHRFLNAYQLDLVMNNLEKRGIIEKKKLGRRTIYYKQKDIKEDNILVSPKLEDEFINKQKVWVFQTKVILKKIFSDKDKDALNLFINSKPSKKIMQNSINYCKDDYDRKIQALINIKGSLVLYVEPDAKPPKIVPEIDRKFNFIKDNYLRRMIKRDYKELRKSIDNDLIKSILILCGSILEAILLDKALENKDKIGNTEEQISKWHLHQLKDELAKINIEIKEADIIINHIKDYRNIIHPGREKRVKSKITKNVAKAVYSNLDVLIDSLK